MNLDSPSRPGMRRIVCGAVLLVFAAGAPSICWSQDPGQVLLFRTQACPLGMALLLWGWSRLRQAKAARLDLTWWQFLHTDLIAAEVVVVLAVVLVVIPAEQRQRLDRFLRESMDLMREIVDVMHIARGHP